MNFQIHDKCFKYFRSCFLLIYKQKLMTRLYQQILEFGYLHWGYMYNYFMKSSVLLLKRTLSTFFGLVLFSLLGKGLYILALIKSNAAK